MSKEFEDVMVELGCKQPSKAGLALIRRLSLLSGHADIATISDLLSVRILPLLNSKGPGDLTFREPDHPTEKLAEAMQRSVNLLVGTNDFLRKRIFELSEIHKDNDAVINCFGLIERILDVEQEWNDKLRQTHTPFTIDVLHQELRGVFYPPRRHPNLSLG